MPGPFSLADTTALERSLTQAGFVNVGSERLTVTFDFRSVEAHTDFLQDIAAPIRALLANQPAERQTEVWQAIREAAGQYAAADGSVQIPNETIAVVGRR